MAKYKVGDLIQEKGNLDIYEVAEIKNNPLTSSDYYIIQNTTNKNYIVRYVDCTFLDNTWTQVLVQGTIGSTLHSNPITAAFPAQFAVGDTVISNKGNEAQIRMVDTAARLYDYIFVRHSDLSKVGLFFVESFDYMHKNFKKPTQYGSNNTKVAGQTPPKDPLIGKLYKVHTRFSNITGVEFNKDDIVEVIQKDPSIYGNYYSIGKYKGDKTKLINIEPSRFHIYMNEYVLPVCECGIGKTWTQVHRKEAPKHLHSSWCKVYEREK